MIKLMSNEEISALESHFDIGLIGFSVIWNYLATGSCHTTGNFSYNG